MMGRSLSPREQRTLQAAAECILPPDGPFSHGHADVDYKGFVGEYLQTVPREVALLLHLILWFVEYLGWVFVRRPGRFSHMDGDRRLAVLEGMHHSRRYAIRGFFILLSTVLLIPFYNDRSVMDAIGYAGYQPGVNKREDSPVSAAARPLTKEQA